MKILEELKAAQELVEDDEEYYAPIESIYPDKIAAVLRRIPQLIEAVEWVESYAQMSSENWSELDLDIIRKVSSGRLFARELLSKLEGKK